MQLFNKILKKNQILNFPKPLRGLTYGELLAAEIPDYAKGPLNVDVGLKRVILDLMKPKQTKCLV